MLTFVLPRLLLLFPRLLLPALLLFRFPPAPVLFRLTSLVLTLLWLPCVPDPPAPGRLWLPTPSSAATPAAAAAAHALSERVFRHQGELTDDDHSRHHAGEPDIHAWAHFLAPELGFSLRETMRTSRAPGGGVKRKSVEGRSGFIFQSENVASYSVTCPLSLVRNRYFTGKVAASFETHSSMS